MRFALLFALLVTFALPVPAVRAEEPAIAGEGDAATVHEPDAGATVVATPAAPAAATVAPVVPAATAPTAKAATPAKKAPSVAAKELFGSVKTAATSLQARSIGSYSKGCLAGAVAMPVDGPNWQAMRLSRNRNWGHPKLVQLLKRFSDEAWRYDGWPGLLVGDLAQPRGGPMSSGHASHQLGLDADVWLTPMPDRRLTNKEREDIAATSMLAADDISVDPKVWTATHAKIIKRAAEYPEVERVLVHPAIKKALCQTTDTDRAWLSKVRPYFGHYYHFHVRIACPEGSVGCTPQKPVVHEDGYGCGKELADWIKLVTPKPPSATPVPPPTHPVKPAPAKPPMSLEQLPAECRMVLTSGNPGIPKNLLDAQRKADQQIAAAHAAAAQKHAAAAQKKGAPAKHETTPAPAMAAKPDTTPGPQTKAAQH